MSTETTDGEDKNEDGRGSYVPKTEAEIEQLAQDLWAGRIYTSDQVSDPSMIGSVFMPAMFVFTGEVMKKWLDENKITTLYEYMSQAGDRSINGMPIFMSMQLLNKDDAVAMYSRADEIQKFMSKRKEKVDG